MWIKNGDELINLDAAAKITVNHAVCRHDGHLYGIVFSYRSPIAVFYNNPGDGNGKKKGCESLWDFITDYDDAQVVDLHITKNLADTPLIILELEEV